LHEVKSTADFNQLNNCKKRLSKSQRKIKEKIGDGFGVEEVFVSDF